MKYLACLSILFAVVMGCDQSNPAAPAAASAALPDGLFVKTAPPAAQEVGAAKASAQAGQSITIRGRVGGSAEPLAEHRAMLTLADLSMPTCDKIPGDQCKTPWDNCCEPSDEITAKSLTVQVAGSDGKPLKTTLNGAGGIAPGKEIVIVGKASRPTAGTVIIDAHQIYVSP